MANGRWWEADTVRWVVVSVRREAGYERLVVDGTWWVAGNEKRVADGR